MNHSLSFTIIRSSNINILSFLLHSQDIQITKIRSSNEDVHANNFLSKTILFEKVTDKSIFGTLESVDRPSSWWMAVRAYQFVAKKNPAGKFLPFLPLSWETKKMNFVKLKNEIISCCISLNTKLKK